MIDIRRGVAGDLDAVAGIQARCPEAAAWDVADYLQYHWLVALWENQAVGFLVWRSVGEGEREILNLGVDPVFRRRGVARGLVGALLAELPGAVFLEVRESNAAARGFYKSMQFEEVSRRRGYYERPPEAAIVMKFHSC